MHGDQALTEPSWTKSYHYHTEVGLSKIMDTVTGDTAAQETPGLDVTRDSKSGTDKTEEVEIPKFHLPSDDLAIELTCHAGVMSSVLKIDRLYRKEDLDEHYIVLNGMSNIQDLFNHYV